MNIASINMLFPYLTLGLLIAGLFVIRSRNVLAFLAATQILMAFIYGIIDPLSLFFLASFWGICAFYWRNLSSKDVWYKYLTLFVLVGIAIAFFNHLVPFHNLRVFDGILISPTAVPFTMYLNFDKTIAAVILVITSGLLIQQASPFRLKAWRDTIIISALCVSLLIPLAVLSGYVHYDPKFPNSFWLWTFNNLYFVCFAEEVLFRGVIQAQLMQLANRWKISPFIPIFISALLFAVLLKGHLQGGPIYIGFATLAGLFYGYAYHRTNRLESAILVHFIVNLTHFLLFSYPMAASLVK